MSYIVATGSVDRIPVLPNFTHEYQGRFSEGIVGGSICQDAIQTYLDLNEGDATAVIGQCEMIPTISTGHSGPSVSIAKGNPDIAQSYFYAILQSQGTGYTMAFYKGTYGSGTSDWQELYRCFWEDYTQNHSEASFICAVRIEDLDGKIGYALFSCTAYVATKDSIYNPGYGVVMVPEILELQDEQYPIVSDFDDDKYGKPSDEEGYDSHSQYHDSDQIDLPPDPVHSTQDTGFMHVYEIGTGMLANLGQYLFPSASNITDVVSALRTIAGIFGYRDSVQYIVDLHAIPVTPTTGASDYIKIGALSTDIMAPVCTSDYVTFDCGSLSLPENFKNYLDYMTKAKLFLPFVGFVDINPEYWIGGTVQVKYKFNIIDGSFMAYVLSTSGRSRLTSTVIGQYGGSACLHMPVIAASYGALASGLVQGSGQLMAAAATGNVAGAVSGALTAGQQQPTMSQSNNYNSSTSYIGVRRPYLLIERMVPSFSTMYPHDKGLPCNVAHKLSVVHGFTQIEDIDLSGLPGASADEIRELKDMLAAGVYL